MAKKPVSDEYILPKGVEVENDFQYYANDIWYNRLNALENLVRNQGEISDGLVKDLKLVARKDEDWRIKELASSMIRSYKANGDFSSVKVYQPKK